MLKYEGWQSREIATRFAVAHRTVVNGIREAASRPPATGGMSESVKTIAVDAKEIAGLAAKIRGRR